MLTSRGSEQSGDLCGSGSQQEAAAKEAEVGDEAADGGRGHEEDEAGVIGIMDSVDVVARHILLSSNRIPLG